MIKHLPMLLIFQQMGSLFFIDRPRHGQLFSRQWLSHQHLERFSFASVYCAVSSRVAANVVTIVG
jgi:hypothetical protein